MWKELIELFENTNDHRKMALKDKLRNINIQNNDTIPQYLTKFIKVRDDIGGVHVSVAKDDLVSLSLLGLPKIWHRYQDLMNEREKFPLMSLIDVMYSCAYLSSLDSILYLLKVVMLM